MQELSAYFSAYESRDNTIGKGTNYFIVQDLSYKEITLMCIDSTLHWYMAAGVTPRMEKASVWQLAKPSRARRCTF